MKRDDLPFPFWIPSQRLGASQGAAEKAELELSRTLPAELKRLLRDQDGGSSQYSGYANGHLYVPLPPFFSLAEIIEAERVRERFGTPDGIVAIASGAHEWLGLDYRLSTEPTVVFQSEDNDIESIASSFEELLAGLVED